jgi:hypothetical protein
MDLYEMLYEGDAIEGYLDAVPFNSVSSTIPKWRTFKFLRWLQGNSLITSEPIGGF